MTRECIAQDTERINLLFNYGVLGANDVIAWADSMIIRMDLPPDSLLELSMIAPDKTADIISCLNRLRSGAEPWPALRSAIPEIRDFVLSHPERAEHIASHLFSMGCRSLSSKVPNDLVFVFRFEDAFTLARDGICGKPEAVYKEFIQAMETFNRL